jgi:hypothetical protein
MALEVMRAEMLGGSNFCLAIEALHSKKSAAFGAPNAERVKSVVPADVAVTVLRTTAAVCAIQFTQRIRFHFRPRL